MNVRSLGVVPAAVMLLAPLVAHSDKATAPASTPEAQTRAALKRLGSLYGPAWTLTYESVITTRQFGPNSGTQTTEAAVHGVLQKPNLYRLEVLQNDRLIGLLVSDGKTVSAYSPQQGLYLQQPAPPDLTLGSLVSPSKALSKLAATLPTMAMTPALFSLATRPDFLGTDATGFGATALPLHGKQALDCSWTEAGATEHLVFNVSSGLPLRTIDSSTDPAGTTMERQEDMTAIQVGNVPLPPSAFEWTPPANAKKIVEEAASPAKPATAPPTSTPPRRRRRRARPNATTGPAANGTDAGRTPPGKIIQPGAGQ